jgi:hypothetical protein
MDKIEDSEDYSENNNLENEKENEIDTKRTKFDIFIDFLSALERNDIHTILLHYLYALTILFLGFTLLGIIYKNLNVINSLRYAIMYIFSLFFIQLIFLVFKKINKFINFLPHPKKEVVELSLIIFMGIITGIVFYNSADMHLTFAVGGILVTLRIMAGLTSELSANKGIDKEELFRQYSIKDFIKIFVFPIIGIIIVAYVVYAFLIGLSISEILADTAFWLSALVFLVILATIFVSIGAGLNQLIFKKK